MKSQRFLTFALVMSLSLFAGCAKTVVPEKPIEQIEKEAAKMSVSDLQKMAGFYAKALKVQRQEVSKITNEMKGLSVKEIFSDKGNSFKDRLLKVQDKASALFERYRIYLDKLQEKGADISAVGLN